MGMGYLDQCERNFHSLFSYILIGRFGIIIMDYGFMLGTAVRLTYFGRRIRSWACSR